MNVFKKLIYLTYIIYLSYLSLKSVKPSEPPFPHFDKVAHCLAHFILSYLFVLNWKSLKLAFIQSLIFGVAIEVGQTFVPSRSFDVLDMLANTTGALLLIGFMKVLPQNWRSIVLGKPLQPDPLTKEPPA